MVEGRLNMAVVLLGLVLSATVVRGFSAGRVHHTMAASTAPKLLRCASAASATTPASSEDLCAAAVAYAAENGILMRSKDEEGGGFEVAPFSLLPQSFPKSEFDRAVSIASSMNKVVDAISRGERERVFFCIVVWACSVCSLRPSGC